MPVALDCGELGLLLDQRLRAGRACRTTRTVYTASLKQAQIFMSRLKKQPYQSHHPGIPSGLQPPPPPQHIAREGPFKWQGRVSIYFECVVNLLTGGRNAYHYNKCFLRCPEDALVTEKIRRELLWNRDAVHWRIQDLKLGGGGVSSGIHKSQRAQG